VLGALRAPKTFVEHFYHVFWGIRTPKNVFQKRSLNVFSMFSLPGGHTSSAAHLSTQSRMRDGQNDIVGSMTPKAMCFRQNKIEHKNKPSFLGGQGESSS
jgi:hypothetical protein